MEVIATRISKSANFLLNPWEKACPHSTQIFCNHFQLSKLQIIQHFNQSHLNVLVPFHQVNPLMRVNFLKSLSLMFQYYLVAFCSASNNFWLSLLIANSCNKSTLTFFRSKNKKKRVAQIKVDSHQTILFYRQSSQNIAKFRC